MIVGTAGHIDHGKTSLVRALTGIDTDRLEEEKARGISIELGYAYVPVEGGDGMLGFVDVPGHERFVHTMVAGATGIDFALLVVAADDGVMPQTREHLAILELLGVHRGAVALTKADRVDPARMAQARDEVRALLAGSTLREAPLFACASTVADDPGIAALRAHLHGAAATAHATHPAAQELFRMPVDRVFTLPGHGTMAAGSVHGGVVAVGDTMRLMPAGLPARIRSIHAQNRAADRARAGQRCALNLAGIAREQLARGDWIADARAFVPSRNIDVRLRLQASHAARLRDWTPLHVHLGTTHRLAHAVLLDDGDAGDGRLVQLVFDAPVCAANGDRFVARDAGATSTIGGGVILDPEASRRRRRGLARMAWLEALEALARGEGPAALLRQAPMGLPMATLARYCRLPEERVALPVDALRIDGADGGHVVLAAHWHALGERVVAFLGEWHDRHPDEAGLDTGRLQRLAVPGIASGPWPALLASLHADGRLQRQGAWWRLPGREPKLAEADRVLLDRLMPLLHAGGVDPPWVRTLATQVGAGEDQVRAALRRAAARGEAYQVVHDLFYHPRRVGELAAALQALARGGHDVEAAAFRDAIGLGRKRSIQLLEFFDRAGYTRRVGDAHRLRAPMQWDATAD